MRELGWTVEAHQLDISDGKAVAVAIDEHVARFGSLDAVFANAGIGDGPGFWDGANHQRVPAGSIENLAQSNWARIMDVNLNGTAYTVDPAASRSEAV